MTSPPTPQQIDEQLGKLSAQLDTMCDELDKQELAAVGAREDYTMAYAKAFLSSTGAMDVRKQTALDETHDERLAAETAEAIVRGLVRRLKTIQSRIDTGRTRSANSRSEHNIARTGAWGA